MNKLLILSFFVLLFLIGGGTAWYLITTSSAVRNNPEQSSTFQDAREGFAIYTNGTYGFSLQYPQDAELSHTFTSSYHLGTTWRAAAGPETSGIPVLEIVPFSLTQENAFPRYYTTMVRVGVSEQKEAVESCLSASDTAGEVALGSVTLGAKSWEAFSVESAGMMQYLQGVSYRTIHEDHCIALEKLRVGSSYRDEPSADDLSQERLDEAYAALDTIVQSITLR